MKVSLLLLIEMLFVCIVLEIYTEISLFNALLLDLWCSGYLGSGRQKIMLVNFIDMDETQL